MGDCDERQVQQAKEEVVYSSGRLERAFTNYSPPRLRSTRIHIAYLGLALGGEALFL